MGAEAGGETRAHAPDILGLDAAQEGPPTLDIERHHQATTRIGIGLRPFVGEFAEHLRRRHPHGDGDACALQHIGANAQAQRPRVGFGHVGEAQESFVDRIGFEIARMFGEDRHHAFGELAIDAEVGREHLDAMRFADALHLEVRRAHRDPEPFGLAGTGHDAPIVVRQHHDGHPDQRRVQDALAGGVEVIAVGEGAQHVSNVAPPRRRLPRYGNARRTARLPSANHGSRRAGATCHRWPGSNASR